MNTASSMPACPALWDAFSSIPDRRSPQGRRYPLPALLLIAVAAMLCGRKTQAGIARWAKCLKPEELQCLGIRQRRAPCPATWCLFFQSLDADVLERYLGQWVAGGRSRYIGHVAIDGKCLRGSRNGDGHATYLLSAFSEKLQGVIGTVRVQAAGSELFGMLELLKTIPLEGTIITGDAAFTRKSVARAILKGGGDYFLTVKGNHKMLRDDIAAAFRSAPYERFFSAMLDKAESKDKGHGRLEHRILEALPAIHGYIDWPGAAQICRIRRVRETGAESSEEILYAITSLPRHAANAEYLLDLARAHWGIENRLHWVRDVTFAEDVCRTRSRDGPQALAALRNTTLTLLRRMAFRPAEGLEFFSERRTAALSFLCRKSPERELLREIRAYQQNGGLARPSKASYKRRRKKPPLQDATPHADRLCPRLDRRAEHRPAD